MAEGDEGRTSPPNEKPFFAIDDEASTGASSPPPTSLFMGSLDTSVSTASSPPPAQLTGDVSVLSGGHAFTLPEVAQKQGMQWGQFFLGMGLPFVVIIVMMFILGFAESRDDYTDYWRYETINAMSEDNSTFEFSIEPEEDEYPDGVYQPMQELADQSLTIRIEAYGGQMSRTDVYQYNYSNGDSKTIGYYEPSNGTVFFQLDGASAESLMFEINYIDQDYYHGGDNNLVVEIVEGAFCMLPFIYVGAIITSFVKGRKSLGYGLITAFPLAFVVLPALFFILLVIAFGGL